MEENTKNDFKNLSSKLFQLIKKNKSFDEQITPYIHILVSHLGEQIAREKNLQRFTQQSIEHWMKVIQNLYFNETNHKDTRDLSQGINSQGMNAVRRLLVVSRVRLLLTTVCPRTTKKRDRKKKAK